MSTTFQSGISTLRMRSDCTVAFTTARSGGRTIVIHSKVKMLYGESIRQQAEATMIDLGIVHGKLEINDFGALPFVIQARIEAAIKGAMPEIEAVSLPPLSKIKRAKSSRDRYRRSRLYIPGIQPKMMVNALVHGADTVILDLEDSVSPMEKSSARLIVRNALRVLDFGDSERLVRINQGDLGMADLEAVVPEPVQLVLIPKAETAQQVQQVAAKIDEISADCGRTEPVFLMPIIESALGIINAYDIGTASDTAVALAIGLEDYTADLGVQRTKGGDESLYARSALVNAAKAAGIQAIATVYSDVADMDGLAETARQVRAMGYDGMGAIHPRQIPVIHENFAPEPDEIEKAKQIVLAFDEAEANGLGVVSLGTKMIDRPVVLRAQRTIDLAIGSGLLKKNWKKSAGQS